MTLTKDATITYIYDSMYKVKCRCEKRVTEHPLYKVRHLIDFEEHMDDEEVKSFLKVQEDLKEIQEHYDNWKAMSKTIPKDLKPKPKTEDMYKNICKVLESEGVKLPDNFETVVKHMQIFPTKQLMNNLKRCVVTHLSSFYKVDNNYPHIFYYRDKLDKLWAIRDFDTLWETNLNDVYFNIQALFSSLTSYYRNTYLGDYLSGYKSPKKTPLIHIDNLNEVLDIVESNKKMNTSIEYTVLGVLKRLQLNIILQRLDNEEPSVIRI